MPPLLWSRLLRTTSMMRILFLGLMMGCSNAPPEPTLSVLSHPAPMPPQVVLAAPAITVAHRPSEDVVSVRMRPLVIEDEMAETPLEEAILNQAMKCGRARPDRLDRALLRDMLRIEEGFDVPLRVRGMVLVAACHESGYDPLAAGDRKFNARGEPMAIGILQQWPWWASIARGRLNRRDPRSAARAWVAHVVKQVPKVKQRCRLTKPSQTDDLWRVAWITAVRSPSKGGRCRDSSEHWARFLRWRPTWEALIGNPEDVAQADRQ